MPKLQRKDLLSLNYYRSKKPFTGSLHGLRYRIIAVPDEDGNLTALTLTLWPEPYAFDATEDSLKESFTEPFSEDALEKFTALINEKSDLTNTQK